LLWESQIRTQAFTVIEIILGDRRAVVNDSFTNDCILGTTISLVNASQQSRSRREPHGVFGSRLDTLASLTRSSSNRLLLRLPRTPDFQINRPEQIEVRIQPACFTSNATLAPGALRFTINPSSGVATVMARTSQSLGWTLTGTSIVPETDVSSGLFWMNVSLAATSERFVTLLNKTRLITLVRKCFSSTSADIMRSLPAIVTASGVTIHPTYLSIRFRSYGEFDVARSAKVQFSVVPELIESKLLPRFTGWAVQPTAPGYLSQSVRLLGVSLASL
jgi:hypothetical protein